VARILIHRVSANFYGLCTGLTPPGSRDGQALTDWFDRQLDLLAGRPGEGTGAQPDVPLTFAMLEEQGIHLALMTTNLCHQRPYLFPLEQNIFLFDENEMRAFFPERVVRWMVRHAYRSDRHYLPEDSPFHFLPAGKDLPVLVAARISLSFPVLFSAVPLYTVKPDYYPRFREDPRTPLGRGWLQQNWFSDGGIVSNFPIHLFDAWLPERPTFGINLSDLPPEAFEQRTQAAPADACGAAEAPAGAPQPERIKEAYRSATEEVPAAVSGSMPAEPGDEYSVQRADAPHTRETVYLPRANEVQALDWHGVDGMTGLVKAIFFTAKDYHDTLQSLLPTYRERIVTIRFASDEGGMNLTMRPETIAKIIDKGRLAGKTLRTKFTFDYHRWVRLRVVLAHLEAELAAIRDVYERDPDYARLLAVDNTRDGFPYRRSKQWGEKSYKYMQALMDFLRTSWPPPPWFNDNRVPRPAMAKRFTFKE
jgi:hypothetical protein